MTHPFRLLAGVNSSAPAKPSTQIGTVDSDFVIILAALLCALICVLGLIAVARCPCFRRLFGRVTGNSATLPPANKGLKKKILQSLPKLTYSADDEAVVVQFSDCAICLSEFSTGDEIRVLPQCGHGFHVTCIDTWLGSHSSCPSCRKILVAAGKCHKCGESSAVSSVTGADTSDTTLNQRADHMVVRFLP